MVDSAPSTPDSQADSPAPSPRPARAQQPSESPKSDAVRTALARLAKQTHRAATSDDSEAIHRVRVATRKLGTALRSYEPLISNKTQHKIKRALKKIRRAGGAVRDIDVAVECLQTVGKELSGPSLLVSFYCRGRLDEQRNSAQQKFQSRCQKMNTERFWNWAQKHLQADFRKHDASDPKEQGLVIKSLFDAYKEVEELLEKHLSEPEKIEPLHALRKALKGFRYTLDMVPPRKIPAPVLKKANRVAQAAQDRLGEIIDVNNTIQMLERISSEQPINKTLLEKNRHGVTSQLEKELSKRRRVLAKGWKHELDLEFFHEALDRYRKNHAETST